MAPAGAALPTSALRYQVGGVYDAILAVCNNSEIDNSIRVEASGLLGCVKQFKFLCCIVIWYKILNCINPISKVLQTEDYDLPSAIELLKYFRIFSGILDLTQPLMKCFAMLENSPTKLTSGLALEVFQTNSDLRVIRQDRFYSLNHQQPGAIS
ncbi:DUF4371 domain-containing protein [Trichonephila clavipes]|nr:DUF4371 domain-containing protein [Trichonephila clavipes]